MPKQQPNFRYNSRQNRPKVAKERLIMGRKPLLEALKEGAEIDKIFLLRNATGKEISEIKQVAHDRNIPVSKVPIEKLNRFSRANHQGIIALASLIKFQSLQAVISQIVEQAKVPLIVVVDGVTDTRNLGAIARSAYCFGAHALVLPAGHSAAITEETLKTSAGALEHLAVCREASLETAFRTLQLNGIHTVATVLSDSESVENMDLTAPVALILGSEDKGVGTFTLDNAMHKVRIPMANPFDSLNVAVAGGIVFYEIFKQRNAETK